MNKIFYFFILLLVLNEPRVFANDTIFPYIKGQSLSQEILFPYTGLDFNIVHCTDGGNIIYRKQGQYEATVTKINVNLDIEWQRSFFGILSNISGVVATEDGGAYIIGIDGVSCKSLIIRVGETGETKSINKISYSENLYVYACNSDLENGFIISGDISNDIMKGYSFYARVSEDGNIKWLKKIDSGNGWAFITTTLKDNYILTISKVDKETNLTQQTINVVNKDGEIITTKTIDSVYNYYISSDFLFKNNELTQLSYYSKGAELGIEIIKYSDSFDVLWTKSYSIGDKEVFPSKIFMLQNEKYLIAGNNENGSMCWLLNTDGEIEKKYNINEFSLCNLEDGNLLSIKYTYKDKLLFELSKLNPISNEFNVIPKFKAICKSQNGIPIIINNKPVLFDVPPAMENNRLLVPMRATFEALGANVTWNQETKTVVGTKGGKIINMKVGALLAEVDNENIQLDSPAKIIDGRTLVPIRFISEALGAKVKWIQNGEYVRITTPDFKHKEYIPIYKVGLSQLDSVVYIKDRMSGVVISSDGLIATTYWALNINGDLSNNKVALRDGNKYDIKKIVGYNKELNLAIIKIDANNLKPIKINKEYKNGDNILGLSAIRTNNTIGFHSDGNIIGINDFLDSSPEYSKQNKDDVNKEMQRMLGSSWQKLIFSNNSTSDYGGLVINSFGEAIGICNYKSIIPISWLDKISKDGNYTFGDIWLADNNIGLKQVNEGDLNKENAANVITENITIKAKLSDINDMHKYKVHLNGGDTILVSFQCDSSINEKDVDITFEYGDTNIIRDAKPIQYSKGLLKMLRFVPVSNGDNIIRVKANKDIKALDYKLNVKIIKNNN